MIDGMEELLENWGRWCRVYPHRSHCLSIEHRYRPSGEEAQEERRRPRMQINELEAVVIERIICHATFHRHEQHLLSAHYVFWWRDYRKTCREIGIRPSEYETRLARAVLMVENRIKKAP